MSVSAHSGRFSDPSATRSPAFTTSSRSPSEIAWTRCTVSRCVTGIHSPPTLERNANGRPAFRSIAVKNNWFSVPLLMLDSWPELHDEAHRTAGHVAAVGASHGGADDHRIRDRRRLELEPRHGD